MPFCPLARYTLFLSLSHSDPQLQVYLPPRDDAAEFDDGGVDLAGHQDDREVVQWRKSNKVSVKRK